MDKLITAMMTMGHHGRRVSINGSGKEPTVVNVRIYLGSGNALMAQELLQ